MTREAARVTATSFLALFSVVGLALYGLPFYYDFMVREFGWSRTVVTSGNAISKLVVGPLFGIAAGWVVDRFGPRRLMMAGILMAGAALAALGVVSALWMFYVAYFVNALGYVCGGPLPNQVLLANWFDRTRGRAMGMAYLGIGIGGAVVPWIAHWTTDLWGWRVSLAFLGVLIVVLALPFAYVVRERPPAERPIDTRTTTKSGASAVPLSAVLKRPAFLALAVGSMCSIAAVGGTNQHLKLYLTLDRAFAQADAARVVSLVLALSIAGRLLMGWLADRWPKKRVMLLVYALIVLAIPLLALTSSPVWTAGFAILFGLGLGGEYLIIPLVAGELFGLAVLGRVMGIVLTLDGVAEATAPMAVGYLRDVTGSYDAGFAVLIGAAVAGAVAVALLPDSLRPHAAHQSDALPAAPSV
jgi:sugar phosphate permease